MESWQIRACRAILKMTQQEFSEILGTNQSTVSRWEDGYSEPDSGERKYLKAEMQLRGIHISLDHNTITYNNAL